MKSPEYPRVLVLLAACNGAGWIREQIESILRQREVDAHIVVSDDGSTDATRSEVESFIPTGRVRLMSPAAPTGSAAQNFFFLIRKNPAEDFDLVAFADQDDLWNPDKLERAHRALPRGIAAGYSSAVRAVWDSGRTLTMRQSDSCTGADFLFEGAGQGCTFVLSAELYRRARAFYVEHRELTQAIHYHDWATYALARVWDARWIFDPHPMVRYRQHRENDTGARYSFAGVRRRFARILDRWYCGQIEAVTRLCLVAAPSTPILIAWSRLFAAAPSCARRARVALFCLRNGRRKAVDNAIVVVAALAGLI